MYCFFIKKIILKDSTKFVKIFQAIFVFKNVHVNMFVELIYKSRRIKLRNYELLSIIKPNIDSEEFEKISGKIEETIQSLEGKVLSTDKMGRKKLSYDIKDFRDGYFVVHNFEMEPAQVQKFNRQLRLNENILRIMLLETSEVKA